MRKLIRVLAGVVVFGALLAVMPTTPSAADHDCAPGGAVDAPCPATGAGTPGNAAGWHEEMPNMKVAGPEHVCVVVGTVKGGNAPLGSAGHPLPGPPAGVDDPAHSHFEFIETAITCDDGAVAVTADGGNDGHVMNYAPAGAPELDGIDGTPTANCAFGHPVGGGNGAHHGSMTESGWSHSSGYTGGAGSCTAGGEHNGGNSGQCAAGPTANKADITITTSAGVTVANSPNFVKYVRLGNVVYYWGCSNAFAAAPYTAPFARRFSGVLAIAPDPRTAVFPLCVVPGGVGCDLLLAGGGTRSNAWLL